MCYHQFSLQCVIIRISLRCVVVAVSCFYCCFLCLAVVLYVDIVLWTHAVVLPKVYIVVVVVVTTDGFGLYLFT